ncbi:hypothetical protein [Salinimicrobium sp. WS361]|uniref:hypothetical protein n=1 Tax=Salinimicrobium sp. WS361 TaxID=3425123 RepID=UPI003D6F3697
MKEIQKIIDTFGMKAEVAAKAMGVTTATFRKKKSEKSLDHSFNQKNLEDLKDYIVTSAKKLEKKTK